MNHYSAIQNYANLVPSLRGKTQEEHVQESFQVLTDIAQIAERKLSNPPLTSYFKECVVPMLQSGAMTSMGQKIKFLRRLYSNSLTDAYSQVIKKHFLPEHSILEIGAGEQGTALSNLSSFCKWTFSDFVKPKSAVDTCIQLDITQTPPKDLEHSFNGIVGNNVLDMIAYRDLPVVFRNMGQLLKDEGLVVHFADLSCFAEAFVDACADAENSILLPAGPQIKHMYRISKADYEQVLQTKRESLTTEEWKFLSEWGQKPLQLQVAVLSYVQKTAFIYLAERIKSIFENSSMVLLESQALFEDHLQRAAQENGWTIIQNNYVIGEELVDETDFDTHNYWCLKQGNLKKDNSPFVPDYQVRREAHVHVFIAKRKKPHEEIM